MADSYTVSRLGANLGGVDKLELFYKIFTGEILKTFENSQIMMGKHKMRTISSGKSAGFNVMGFAPAATYHTPGDEITGSSIKHTERVISIDGLLLAHTFIANIDEAMNHYDVRAPYAEKLGYQLAQRFDISVINEILKAAVATATIPGETPVGLTITNAKFKKATGDVGTAGTAANDAEIAAAIFEALTQAAENFVSKNIPQDGNWHCALRPRQYFALLSAVQSSGFSLLNKDFNSRGDVANPMLPPIMGFNIHMSNNIGYTDTTGSDTYHGVDAAKVVGAIWTPEAVGTVKLLDMALESDYQVERQGTLMVAKMAMGHGVLQPECAVKLEVA